MKHNSILGAISTDNGDVATTVLTALLFQAGIITNQCVTRIMNGTDTVVMDQFLAETLGFDGEEIAKPVDITDAVTLYNAVLVALAEWAKMSIADDKGRKSFPYAWLAQPSVKTGRMRLQTLPQYFEEVAEYRVSRQMQHFEQQIAIIQTATKLKDKELETMRQARLAAEKANQAQLAKDKVQYLGDWRAEIKALGDLSKDDLFELIDQKCVLCNVPDSIVRDSAQRSVEFARERLLRGQYTNIDAEVALMAK